MTRGKGISSLKWAYKLGWGKPPENNTGDRIGVLGTWESAGREEGEHLGSHCLEAESETEVPVHVIYGGWGVSQAKEQGNGPVGKERRQTHMWFQWESRSV